jgi:hypothetical protein
MKKNSVLWLFPLAAVLLIGVSADLSALSAKDEKQLAKLEETLEKKGKLSSSNQKKYDQLKADKAAEASLRIVEPSATLGGETTPIPIVSVIYAENELQESPKEFSSNGQFGSSAKETSLVESGSDEVPPWVTDPRKLDKILLDLGLITEAVDDDGNVLSPVRYNGRDELIVGIGTAKDTTPQKSIQLAEARARQDIAIQANSVVRARIRDYAETREDNNKRGKTHSDSSISSVAGSQSTDLVLTNVQVVQREQSKTDKKTWWVVAVWPKSEIGSTTLDDTEGDYVQRALDEFKAMDAPSEPAALKPAATVTESVAVVSE